MTMRALEAALQQHGVVGDAREPDILRLAPAPLYNNFSDVRRAVDALQACLA
jgi:kynureninase